MYYQHRVKYNTYTVKKSIKLPNIFYEIRISNTFYATVRAKVRVTDFVFLLFTVTATLKILGIRVYNKMFIDFTEFLNDYKVHKCHDTKVKLLRKTNVSNPKQID